MIQPIANARFINMARWRRIGLKLLLYKPTTMPNTRFVRTYNRILAATLLFTLGFCANNSFAGLDAHRHQLAQHLEPTSQLLLRKKSGSITQAQAAQIAKKRYGGKVLSVTKKGGEKPAYKVKLLLDDGRVKVVTVDANSGAAR